MATRTDPGIAARVGTTRGSAQSATRSAGVTTLHGGFFGGPSVLDDGAVAPSTEGACSALSAGAALAEALTASPGGGGLSPQLRITKSAAITPSSAAVPAAARVRTERRGGRVGAASS